MAKLIIRTPYRAPGITVERFGKFDWVIPYVIDNEGPFEVRVPEEIFSPEVGEQKVRTQAELQIRLKGKEITL